MIYRSTDIINAFTSLHDEKKALHLSRFFKTGEGEYGEGDKFLGITVPQTRSIVKKYAKHLTAEEIVTTINSEWHEIRLAGFLLLIEEFRSAIKHGDFDHAKSCLDLYIANLDKGNNWDLVDLVAPNILGEWVVLVPEEEKLLHELSSTNNLWSQRVAIVATFALIKRGIFKSTLLIAEKYLPHRHDLIHKATGWMLREVGKRGGKKELTEFLNLYKSKMPRTMLRYAIERFPEEERRAFMQKM